MGHIPGYLHSACTLPRRLNPFHPHHPSLSCREDMDPTSGWVLALLRKSARPLCPHRCLPTFIPPIYPHSTRPLCCPPSSQLRLFPPQPPKNNPPLLHGSLGLHRRQLPVPTQVGQCSWLAARLGLETPHHTSSTPPQKATDRVPRPNRPLFVLPAFFNHTPLSPYPPLSPTTLPSMPTASAYPWW